MRRISPAELSIVAPGLLLAACKGSGVDATLGSAQTSGQTGGQTGLAAGGQVAGLPQPDPVQDPRAYCPKTVMRAGTETLDLYPLPPKKAKKVEPPTQEQLRFRAVISEVVRECDYAGEFLNMKVGVAGRVISGPSGETGTITLPVRIAVTQGDAVLYSQLHDIAATVDPGHTSGNFSFVDQAISFPKPQDKNIIVYVGFDEQRTDAAGAKGEKKDQKRVN